tara:strand:+ start:832 stop:1314 length:483 start_codon:yes stop_codon:yes gene_type:complete
MAIRPNRKPLKFASGAKDKQQRNAIEKAVADAMRDESGRALSFDDVQLLKEMIDRKEGLAASMMGMTKPKPRPDVGAIERGNRAARRTAQDLASMEDGGVALSGGQKKLDKNQDGKLSKEDFDILRKEKKNTKVKKMMGGGQVCRGGGAAVSGTKFSGVR